VSEKKFLKDHLNKTWSKIYIGGDLKEEGKLNENPWDLRERERAISGGWFAEGNRDALITSGGKIVLGIRNRVLFGERGGKNEY